MRDPRITRGRRQTHLVFGAPAFGEEEIEAVTAAMRSGWIGTGPRVSELEGEFARYKGSAHAVALGSCTAALHLSILALDLQPGDEVITTPLTFVATINSIIHAGGVPVLADVHGDTMNVDVESIRSRITARTRAIVPVHFAGRPCEMDGVMALAREHNLAVIEDCAHAIETTYKGRAAGTFGEFGCFSFYVTKNVAAGEGGMVVTEDADAAARIKVLGLHGMSKDAWKRYSDEGYRHYDVVGPGFKYNMMDLQAAIAVPQLRRVESNWSRRLEIWQRYDQAFGGLPLGIPAPLPDEPGTRHALHLYTVLVDPARSSLTRDSLMNQLDSFGVGVGVHYRSVTEFDHYRRRFGWDDKTAPTAMVIGRQTVSLPLGPSMTDDDVDDVIEAVTVVVGEAARSAG